MEARVPSCKADACNACCTCCTPVAPPGAGGAEGREQSFVERLRGRATIGLPGAGKGPLVDTSERALRRPAPTFRPPPRSRLPPHLSQRERWGVALPPHPRSRLKARVGPPLAGRERASRCRPTPLGAPPRVGPPVAGREGDQLSSKCRSPSFSMLVTILSPGFSQTCLSFG